MKTREKVEIYKFLKYEFNYLRQKATTTLLMPIKTLLESTHSRHFSSSLDSSLDSSLISSSSSYFRSGIMEQAGLSTFLIKSNCLLTFLIIGSSSSEEDSSEELVVSSEASSPWFRTFSEFCTIRIMPSSWFIDLEGCLR